MGLLPGNLAGAEPQHYDLGVARLAIAASHRLCFSLVLIYQYVCVGFGVYLCVCVCVCLCVWVWGCVCVCGTTFYFFQFFSLDMRIHTTAESGVQWSPCGGGHEVREGGRESW